MNYPRRKFTMTQADYDKIIEACRPVPYIMVGNCPPRSQQENANDAWAELGSRLNFDSMTVEPFSGDKLSFTAVPAETAEQRAERELNERAEKRATEILTLQREIAERTARLEELNTVSIA